MYPGDMTGCGHYRLIWPAQALQRAGHDVTIVYPGERDAFTAVMSGDRVVRVNGIPDGTDLVVMQRVTHRHLAAAIPVLRRQGVAVVIDQDDDLSAVHPANPAHQSMHPRAGVMSRQQARAMKKQAARSNRSPVEPRTGFSWEAAGEACKAATMVTVSTPALARRYGRFGQARVIRNRVPEDYLWVRHTDSPVAGYAGSLHSHPDDIPEMGFAVRQLVDDGAAFRVIGSGEGFAAALGLDAEPPATGVVPFGRWAEHVATLGVGVVPLADTAFNQAKCIDTNTRVTTRRGVIRAGAIAVGDEVWHDNRWAAVEATEHDLPRPGVLITVADGYQIRLTPEHRMLVNGEWVTADRIAVGDIMAMEPEAVGPIAPVRVPWPSDSRMSRDGHDPRAYLTAPDGPRLDLTPRWGRFLGAFAGDGSAGQRTALTIACDGQDQDWIDLLMEDFRSFGLVPHTEKVTTWGGELLRRRHVRVSSAHLLRVMESWGVVEPRPNGQPKRVPCVPEVIWRSPREVIAEFLAAYFEADGCCTSNGVSATSKSEALIRDVQRLLLLFGIESRVHAKQGKSQNGTGGTYWYVNLRRAAADVFAKEIGFRSARKQARLAAITSRPHSNAYRPMKWAQEVVSVQPCMVTPVDIQVDGSVFAAAGFVSHNSALKGLEYAACGVPFVASPREEYVRLHERHGLGLLARRPRDWYRHLRALVDSPGMRQDMSGRGREVAEEMTYERHAHLWAEAWADAVRIQRGQAAA